MKLVATTAEHKKKKGKKDLFKSCQKCDGNLIAFEEPRYLTLLGKKVLPLKTRNKYFYKCESCGSTYSPSIKYISLLNDEERRDQINSSNDIYARLMVASLVYTALVDGKFSMKEEELLEMVVNEASEFPSTQVVLQKVFELKADAKEYVFTAFEFAKQHLSRERIESVIIANARMVLVDGRIKKPEQKLLRSYIKAGGIELDLKDIMIKAHNEQYQSEK